MFLQDGQVASGDVRFAAIREKFQLTDDVQLAWAKQYLEGGEVRDWTGSYVVSSEGNVYSLWFGDIKQLKPQENRKGYLSTTLHGGKHHKRVELHRLVASAFLDQPPEGREVCHCDGNKTNNRLRNLRYDTRKANHFDKHFHGTNNAGERNGSAKLTAEQAQAIIHDYDKGGWTQKELGEKYEITHQVVSRILAGEMWTELTRPNLKPLTCEQAQRCKHVVELYEDRNLTFLEAGKVLGLTQTRAVHLYNRALVHGLTHHNVTQLV